MLVLEMQTIILYILFKLSRLLDDRFKIIY